jgi:protein TonB
VARDALRETFPFGVPDVEKAISQNDFDEAAREIDLLSKADPTNYTLTLLRSKLDAQRKLQARQEQAQLQAQQAAQLAAAQQAAAAKAAAEKEAAAKKAAEQQAAEVAKAAPPPKPTAPPPAPAKPAGETRNAVALSPAAPEYPLQAARNQTSGYAVVEFTVSPDGSVDNPHVIDSSPRRVFDSAAIQAVRSSKFKPALKDGEPVASTLRRRIDFKFGG